MAAISLLEIPKWKEETFKADFTKPEVVDYFTANYNNSNLSKDINSLKYFDSKAKLNAISMKLKFDNDLSKTIPVKDESSLPVKQWLKDNCCKKYFEGVEIVTFPSVLSTIMNTPFEINGEKKIWSLNATFECDKIFLIPMKTENRFTTYKCYLNDFEVTRPCHTICKESRCECHQYRVLTPPDMPKYYELMKRYLFVKKPENTHRKIISKWDKSFYEIYKLNIGDNKILYLSKTAGVLSAQKLNSVEELKTAEHIYCDVTKLGDFTQEVINYNPIWWSKAQLINAKQCYICVCNNVKDELEDIINFNMDKFENTVKYENLWSQNAAWNFLNDVLIFIKDEVYKIDAEYRSLCSWEFKSFEEDRPYITVIPYGPKKFPIPDIYIS